MAGEYRFDSRWFKDIPAEEVEALKAQLAGDKKTLDKIKEIVYNMVKGEEDTRVTDYDSPNWSHKQAHLLGRRDAFCSIMRLVDLDNGS